VTAALRPVAELSQFLLDRNLHTAAGQQSIGLLALVVLKGEQLFLAQCGPLHAFLIKAGGAEHIHDSEAALRGLGLGRATPIRYSQTGLSPSDTIILSHQPLPNWTEVTLSGLHGQGPEGLRRRLLGQATSDLSAILLQAKSGQGEIHLLQPQPFPTYVQPGPSPAVAPDLVSPEPVEAAPDTGLEQTGQGRPQVRLPPRGPGK
jgi:hypothetical protein